MSMGFRRVQLFLCVVFRRIGGKRVGIADAWQNAGVIAQVEAELNDERKGRAA